MWNSINLIEFHIWYLKEKGWIQRLENGKFALTAPGVDEVEKGRLRLNDDRLLAASAENSENNTEPVRSFPVQIGDYW